MTDTISTVISVDTSTATMPIPKTLLRAEPGCYGMNEDGSLNRFSEDFIGLALRLAGCSVRVWELDREKSVVLRDEHLSPINGFPVPQPEPIYSAKVLEALEEILTSSSS